MRSARVISLVASVTRRLIPTCQNAGTYPKL
jgi:hypothetical protein